MSAKYTTRQNWVLALLAGLTAAIIGSSFYLVGQLQEANWWVNHTLHVQKEVQGMLVGLLNCETSCRGFLMTGDPAYLEPYQDCHRHVAQHLSTLTQLTANNPRQKKLVSRLSELADAQIKFSQMAVSSHQHDLHMPGHIIVSLYPGKKFMDDFRLAAGQILSAEDQLLSRRLETATRLREHVYIAIALLSVCVSAALIWIARSSRTYTIEQARAHAETAAARDEAIKARDAAVKANELKSRFVANVSHEVRTPMSGIIGLTELLKNDPSLSPEGRESVERVYAASNELLAVLNDLLDFSKLESDRVEVVNERFSITELLDQILQLIHPQIRQNGLKLVLSIDDNLKDNLIGDRQKIKQVLLNLAQNAVKFTETGEIGLSVSLIEVHEHKMTVKFSVTDTGLGIDPEAQSRLFQPFVQADGSMQRRFGGTGLGLSICKRLVELLGGQIGVTSIPGQGSSFWFSIPLIAEDGNG